MAKCYYAKHKLVWEVLDGSLKNKIEILEKKTSSNEKVFKISFRIIFNLLMLIRSLFQKNPKQIRKKKLNQ